MAFPKSVTIVGLGLIGSSIGLALKAHGFAGSVWGIGRHEQSLAIAQKRGAIDDYFVGQVGDLVRARKPLSQSDLVVLCVPVTQIVPWCRAIAPEIGPQTWVTDAGSTKGDILRQVEAELGHFRFVGSHPLAGSEKTGPEAGFATLYEGKTCVVTPTATTQDEGLALVRAFWEGIGMNVVHLDPTVHDEILARTSHLPHVVAALLSKVVTETDRPFSGSGLRDTTRIAAGDPALWRGICTQNRPALLEALRSLKKELIDFESALERFDFETIERMLTHAKRNRDALGN